MHSRLVINALFVTLLGLFLLQIFSLSPFLDHELLGIMHWWTNGEPFLSTLFDGTKMDGYPGRFRYVEYLSEAAYWKLMKAGFLPKDLYDYWGIIVLLGSALLVFLIGRQKKINHFVRLLWVAFFLFSTQSQMVPLFHFRKAKYMTTFFLLFIAWVQQRPTIKKSEAILLVGTAWLGTLTDPTFILLASAFALIIPDPRGKAQCSIFGGVFLGLVSALLLNGLIGPQFSEHSRVVVGQLAGVPGSMLRVENLPYAPKIISDLIFPALLAIPATLVSLLVLLALIVLYRKMRQENYVLRKYLLLFVVALPLNSYLIRPSSFLGFYSASYGQPILAFFILAGMEVAAFLELKRGRVFKLSGALILLLLICLHQIRFPVVMQKWQSIYCDSRPMASKIQRDYAQLKEIREYLKSNSAAPYLLPLDLKSIKHLYPLFGTYREDFGAMKHTDLAYLGFPVFFSEAMAQGKLKIIVE